MHKLLNRQLRKCFNRTDGLPDDVLRFAQMVDEAYGQGDEDRAMTERSMELSSRELLDRNAELLRAERKYRDIFENVTEGIFQATPEGRYVAANPAMAQLLGYASAEELRTAVTEIGSQIYVDAKQHAAVLAAVADGGAAAASEAQWRRKDGTVIWITQTVRGARDAAGKLEYYEGSVWDVTARKQAEADRQELQSRLISISRQAGISEVATGVLHNVGNALNSVNVSATLVSDRLRNSKMVGVVKVAEMLQAHREELGTFLTQDEKGKQIPEYLRRLGEHLTAEQQEVLDELRALSQGVEHVKQIVSMQQSYAKVAAVLEEVEVAGLVEDAIRMNTEALARYQMELVREMEPLPTALTDKHQVLQILINLISNARHAMREVKGEKKLTVRVAPVKNDAARFMIQVRDTGIGIPAENLTRIFGHGFTTKPQGHGFGLHTSALTAKAMGGSLVVQSDGAGTGATFTLELPLRAQTKPQESLRAA